MKQYDSYQIDNDMWYKKRKHIYHLLGDYNDEHDGHCACIIATYSLKTKRLLIKGANEHIPESKILSNLLNTQKAKDLRRNKND